MTASVLRTKFYIIKTINPQVNLDLELEGSVEAVAELEVEQHPKDDLQDSTPTSNRLLHLEYTGCPVNMIWNNQGVL